MKSRANKSILIAVVLVLVLINLINAAYLFWGRHLPFASRASPFTATVYKLDCNTFGKQSLQNSETKRTSIDPIDLKPAPDSQTNHRPKQPHQNDIAPLHEMQTVARETTALTPPMVHCIKSTNEGLRYCQLHALIRGDSSSAEESIRAMNTDGYYLASSTIVRGAADTLHEFIVRNYLAGVDHFYIYDDNDDEQEDVQAILKPFAPIVTVKKPPSEQQFLNMIDRDRLDKRGKPLEVLRSRQHMANWQCFQLYGNTTKWLISIDADEFFEAKHPENVLEKGETLAQVPFMHRFLSKVEHLPAQMARWDTALTNNKLHPPYPRDHSLASMFPNTCGFKDEYAAPDEPGYLFSGKTAIQPKYLDLGYYRHKGSFFIHGVKHWISHPVGAQEVFCTEPFKDFRMSWNTTDTEWTIVHYWSRSVADYVVKQERGRADGLRKRNLDELLEREVLCREYDHIGKSQSTEDRKESFESLLRQIEGRNEILEQYYNKTVERIEKNGNDEMVKEFEKFLEKRGEKAVS